MITNVDGTYFQENDIVRIKRTGEVGRVNATDGGVVYVLMNRTDETKVFSAYIDEDALIEIVPETDAVSLSSHPSMPHLQ